MLDTVGVVLMLMALVLAVFTLMLMLDTVGVGWGDGDGSRGSHVLFCSGVYGEFCITNRFTSQQGYCEKRYNIFSVYNEMMICTWF